MPGIEDEIERMAEEAVELAASMGRTLDYSEASVPVVEEVLAEISETFDRNSEKGQLLTVQRFGCYLLAVGQQAYGGRMSWFDRRNQPVLVVGEPACRIAVITWDKVEGRLRGDEADNIPFFWEGFAERARRRAPGDDVLVT